MHTVGVLDSKHPGTNRQSNRLTLPLAICIRIESSHRSGRAWKPSPAIDPQGLAQGFTLSLEPCVGRQPQRQRKAPDQHEPTDQPRHDDLLALGAEILELAARRRTQAGARNEESPMVASPDT